MEDARVVFINGARQAGKSTLVRELAETKNTAYATLDDPAELDIAVSDPNGYISGLSGTPKVIDEVQKAPQLLSVIKRIVDEDDSPGQFLLTGSTHILSTRTVYDSLAGRVDTVKMYPLSQGEVAGRRERFIDAIFGEDGGIAKLEKLASAAAPLTITEFADSIATGGYPEVLRRTRRNRWFSSYLESIIARDIRDITEVSRTDEIRQLLRLLASRTGSLENIANISKNSGIPKTTVKRYMSLLEAVFLYQPLEPWHRNIGKRAIKARKAHIGDTGIATWLLGLNADRLAADKSRMGNMAESFAVAELRKQATWSQARVDIMHFRTHAKREVDIVLENPLGHLAGIEIKISETVSASDFTGIRALAEAAGEDFLCGVVLYLGNGVHKIGQNLAAMPISSLWV